MNDTTKKFVSFLLTVLIIFVSGGLAEKLFHHSFEKFILALLQRIDYSADRFSSQIVVIDTSPIYDLSVNRTNRVLLADVLRAVKIGRPRAVGLDIRLEPDSVYQDIEGDHALKAVLDGWRNMIVPDGVDPYFGITDTGRLASIRISDGFEIPVSLNYLPSLPFRMAGNGRIPPLSMTKKQIVRYRMTLRDLRRTDQYIRADDLLSLFYDETLTQEEKEDELGMLLASQYVLLGFCDETLNIDKHSTPVGVQPGVLIWANTLHTLLQPEDRIRYHPLRIWIIWSLVVTASVFILGYIHQNLNYFYAAMVWFHAVIATIVWLTAATSLFFRHNVAIPVFSYTLVCLIAFPAYLQSRRFALLIRIIGARKKIAHLPGHLRYGYMTYMKETNPFKKVHIAFNLLEQCIQFTVLLGLAQMHTLGLRIKGKSPVERHQFQRLSFGHWQALMRLLTERLKDEKQILEEWKTIYLVKDENRRWKHNALYASMERNFQHLRNLEQSCRETSKPTAETGKKLDRKVIHLYTAFLRRFWTMKDRFRVVKRFNTKHVESIMASIEARIGQIHNVIQLRNKMVHDGGAFMTQAECSSTLALVHQYIYDFLFKKLSFWRYAIVSEDTNHPGKLLFKLNETAFDIHPFFLLETCLNHMQTELYVMAATDYRANTTLYHGRELSCRLSRSDSNPYEILSDILKISSFNGK